MYTFGPAGGAPGASALGPVTLSVAKTTRCTLFNGLLPLSATLHVRPPSVDMLHWRADGKEVFFRGQNLESSDLLVVSVDVATAPTFTVGTPKVLFRLPGPMGGNLGNISRDGQRFVFAVNVPAAGTR